MRKNNLLLIVFCIFFLLQIFSYALGNNTIIKDLGQVDFSDIDRINEDSMRSYVGSKKILHCSSINIIEKYLTIYMILFIFSFYIKNRYIKTD